MEHAEATWKGVAEVVAVEHSFEDFVELEQERLLRLLWMVTGTLQEAEDIVQTRSCACVRQHRRFEPGLRTDRVG
jgi:DNA-directed RNA polymerase specialized sigma24 family protein